MDAASTTIDIKGNPARQSPKFVAAGHAEYDIPTGNGGRFTLSGDVSYKSRQYFSEFKDEALSQGSYVIFDSQLRYVFPNTKWSVAGWVKNIGNRLVESSNYALSGPGYVTARTFLPPRTFGGTVGVTF